MKKCPQCHQSNEVSATECSNCGVIFAHARRARAESSSAPATCAWSDLGRPCPCRGIINTTGQWYCREHWERLNGGKPAGTGNYTVPYVRSKHAAQWDAWYPQWLARRDRRRLPNPIVREPGMDDDLEALVPEEVGQG